MRALQNQRRRVSSPTDEFFRQALSDAMLEAVMLPVALPEKQVVALKPGFNTACWTFVPPHKIYIGTSLFDKEKETFKGALSAEQQKKYIASHYHHERAHALYTERDFGKLNKALHAIGSPFSLYNLFEDAWIEHRYRKETAFKFGWLDIERLAASHSASSLLFGLIQAEGDVDAVKTFIREAETEDDNSKVLGKFERVAVYYEQITSATSSMGLMPILKAWLREFAEDNQGEAHGSQDIELSIGLGTSAYSLSTFEQGAVPLHPEEKAGKDPGTFQDSLVEASTGVVLGTYSYPLNQQRVDALTEKLKKIFQNKSKTRYTDVPSHRLSASKFCMGRPAFKTKADNAKKKQSVLVVVDCSGSMRGTPIEEGRILLAALSQLARMNLLEGKVILSGVAGSTPKWQRFALPMSLDTIQRVAGVWNGEGLKDSLSQNWSAARDADYVFVYTDGCLTDKKIDKAFLHQKGIYTWGLYVGEADMHSKLKDYFDRSVIRASIEELADAIVANRF